MNYPFFAWDKVHLPDCLLTLEKSLIVRVITNVNYATQNDIWNPMECKSDLTMITTGS